MGDRNNNINIRNIYNIQKSKSKRYSSLKRLHSKENSPYLKTKKHKRR